MRNIYYEIWVDAIVRVNTKNPNEKNWKILLYMYVTLSNSLNLSTIDVLLKSFGIDIPTVEVAIFPLRMFNSFASFVMRYASVFIPLNYFLIFRNDRYKKLIKIYPYRNGRLGITYMMVSLFVGAISSILYGILS